MIDRNNRRKIESLIRTHVHNAYFSPLTRGGHAHHQRNKIDEEHGLAITYPNLTFICVPNQPLDPPRCPAEILRYRVGTNEDVS